MKKAAFAVIAVLIVFALAETVARLAGSGGEQATFMRFTNPHREQSGFVPDDHLFWRLRENNPSWEVNASGFRGPDAPREKPAGQFRIVTLGDSCTFGLGTPGLRYDETYSARLEQLLREAKPGRDIRVLNFGCPGYSSFQGLRLLESKAAAYRPDLVIAYFGINDGFDAVGFADKDQRPVDAPALGPMRGALAKSRLYAWLRGGLVRARRTTAPGEPLERVAIDDHHANLDAMAALTTRIGAKIHFIAPPYLEESDGSLRIETHRRHDPAIDVFPEMSAAAARGETVIFASPDNVHPTPAGHAAIARAIADVVVPEISD
ncbi:MAG: SGNH/GDSL hydrolase family protein [Deltaproteobacteria bacterium]|nr:SGNH/GDSL hydrolase family protein [Deltaproteobacteria bacterium]